MRTFQWFYVAMCTGEHLHKSSMVQRSIERLFRTFGSLKFIKSQLGLITDRIIISSQRTCFVTYYTSYPLILLWLMNFPRIFSPTKITFNIYDDQTPTDQVFPFTTPTGRPISRMKNHRNRNYYSRWYDWTMELEYSERNECTHM